MNSRGNAFVYILIAVALFAGLTFALTSADQGNNISELDEGRAKVAANSIVSYAVSAQNAIVSLDKMGTSATQISFIQPSEAAFNTAPNLNKLFHPDGGGLTYKPLLSDAIDASVTGNPKPGFYIGRFNNFEWTPTAAYDVIFAAFGINRAVCKQLNLQQTGSDTIPALASGTLEAALVDVTYHSGSNANVMTADCGTCTNKSSFCFSNPAGTKFGYVSILVAR